VREGNIGGALLLYQEVLTRGFGGQHFLTGLCEHLRNLMVSLDPQTLTLAEGGERLRARYREQSQHCGLPLLLGCLNTASDYEFRFREANNKRLFVEICLMKMASTSLSKG
jgi:DNA polymerase-3 subunit gamma/tau